MNLPGNPSRHGKPTIQGALILLDGDDGRPLAIMDSIALTSLRTAAVAALAASCRPSSQVACLGERVPIKCSYSIRPGRLSRMLRPLSWSIVALLKPVPACGWY